MKEWYLLRYYNLLANTRVEISLDIKEEEGEEVGEGSSRESSQHFLFSSRPLSLSPLLPSDAKFSE